MNVTFLCFSQEFPLAVDDDDVFLLVSVSTQSSVVLFFSSETSLKKDPQGEVEKDRISIMKETQRQKKITEATPKNEHLTITTTEKERFDHSS